LRIVEASEYSREEISKLKAWQLNSNVTNENEWKEFFNEIKQEGQRVRENQLIGKNGKIEYIRIYTDYINYEGSEYLFSIIRNITKVKKRDALLQRMEFSLDHAREMITWINEEGSIIYANNQFLTQTGYSKKDIGDIKLWHLAPNVSKEQWKDLWRRFQSEKSILPSESLQQEKDGRVYPVEVSGNYLEHEGTPYIFAVTVNVSKKKEREDLLLKMKYSFDHAQEMICWFDEKGRFLYTNDKMAEECGYTVEELLQMHLWDISPRITPTKWKAIWNKFKTERFVQPYETHHLHKDGTIFPVEVSANYLNHKGKEYLFAIAKNISEKKAAEAKIRNTVAELEELKKQLEGERNYLQEEITSEHNFNEIITKNKDYRKLLKLVQQVAVTDATVLIQGETGTGKELIARAVHDLGSRRDRPMIKVNCASLPENLIESELFGHEKGSFTGAYQRKIGRFELADRGTLFLDEIGELPLELQAKMLRALQEGEFERLGGRETIKVDVRVIAATNRNLEEMVAAGTFREDLYYRINVFPLFNPPLRNRKDDIPVLVKYFLRKYSKKMGRPLLKVSQTSIDRLMAYEFPGNIRELENLIERAIILSNKEVLNLAAVLSTAKEQSARKNQNKEFLTFEELQREHIIQALNRTHWKVTGQNSASELLKINGKTLASKMRKLNIKR